MVYKRLLKKQNKKNKTRKRKRYPKISPLAESTLGENTKAES